jgi:hypothetical protein
MADIPQPNNIIYPQHPRRDMYVRELLEYEQALFPDYVPIEYLDHMSHKIAGRRFNFVIYRVRRTSKTTNINHKYRVVASYGSQILFSKELDTWRASIPTGSPD